MTRKAYNHVAICGHSGWFSSAIVGAFAASGASVKVLYQTDSDIIRLPLTAELDVKDQKALMVALHDVDIVI
jgi:nucleoside-diphosphate-sugar epimerase